jgi:hypothetical protein
MRVTIPAPLAAEVAADLAAGGDRAKRWQPIVEGPLLLLKSDGWLDPGRVVQMQFDHGPVCLHVQGASMGVATPGFWLRHAWAPVGGVDGGPRPEPGQRLLARRTPMRVHDGHVGICRSARPVIAEFNPEHPAERDLAGSFAVTEWAILPPEVPAEVHALRADLDQAWMCADFCCSKGCPGIGNALHGPPWPCTDGRCTCGNAHIRAVAHDRQRLARILTDLTAWLTAERSRLRDAAMNTTSAAGNLDAAFRRVLDWLRDQGLDVDYLGEPAAVPDVVAREALETGDAT